MNQYQKYSKFEVQKVKDSADIRDFIPGCTRKAEQMIECPFCHSKRFSVVHKGKKNFARCFSCEKTFPNAIDAVMHYEGLDWLPALEYVANHAGIIITPEKAEREAKVKKAVKSAVKSFCEQQLSSSGLTMEDVLAKVVGKDGREEYVCTFRKGGIDAPFTPNDTDDEMLIYYYGLDGRPKTYVPKGNGARAKQYVRVRWSNPDAHPNADGKSTKYKTPAGAPSQVYIPQIIRQKYQNSEPIETLFIQEGEKKAEKACKHGILSVGIQGINNFGTVEGGLLKDIQYLVQQCAVKNVVLIMDSDWEDLHRNIITGDNLAKRPNSFSKAVIKFNKFIRSLSNLGYYADAWWGHVNINDAGDKGVDDLLVGLLNGREQELADSIREAMNAHNGESKWVNIHKITSITDIQIEDFWKLNSPQDFYNRHKDRLNEVETFKIRNIRYKAEDGKLVPINKTSTDIEIWSIELDSKDREKVIFNTAEAFDLLKCSGFAWLKSTVKGHAPNYELIRINEGIIDYTSSREVREYIREYVMATCQKPVVRKFFLDRLSTLMADKQLESIESLEENFNNFSAEKQRLYFNDGVIEITSQEITPNLPMCNVWRSRIVPRKFKRTPIFQYIRKEGKGFDFELTDAGYKCEFLRYIMNTSNTFFKPEAPRDLTDEEIDEYSQRVVNKITAIGYLLSEYKFMTEAKAVVVQDYQMSEVGQSSGGSGKSIIGNAIEKIVPQVFIDGKAKDDNDFLYERVNSSTRNIFIDDVKTNFNFERLFTMITGDMVIQRKNMAPLVLPKEESPKILITTNHAINKSDENATLRRIIYVENSTWYSPRHTLMDDFGHRFFDDWLLDGQWILFDNLMAECVMFYLRSLEEGWTNEKGTGAVAPPMANIKLRSLRQEMSEVLYQWAEEYFDPTGSNLNERRQRKELYNSFVEYAGNSHSSVSRSNFKKKIISYCCFKGYDFNVNRPNQFGQSYSDWKPTHLNETFIGEGDKAGGIEYFMVYSPSKEVSSANDPFKR